MKTNKRAALLLGTPEYIKDVHGGRWVVKKEQNYVHVVIELPLVRNIFLRDKFGPGCQANTSEKNCKSTKKSQ